MVQSFIYPEHQELCDWMAPKIRDARRPIRFLNLFAYSGLASLVAAQAGAEVCHVDASKGMVSRQCRMDRFGCNEKDTSMTSAIDFIDCNNVDPSDLVFNHAVRHVHTFYSWIRLA